MVDEGRTKGFSCAREVRTHQLRVFALMRCRGKTKLAIKKAPRLTSNAAGKLSRVGA